LSFSLASLCQTRRAVKRSAAPRRRLAHEPEGSVERQAERFDPDGVCMRR